MNSHSREKLKKTKTETADKNIGASYKYLEGQLETFLKNRN